MNSNKQDGNTPLKNIHFQLTFGPIGYKNERILLNCFFFLYAGQQGQLGIKGVHSLVIITKEGITWGPLLIPASLEITTGNGDVTTVSVGYVSNNVAVKYYLPTNGPSSKRSDLCPAPR